MSPRKPLAVLFFLSLTECTCVRRDPSKDDTCHYTGKNVAYSCSDLPFLERVFPPGFDPKKCVLLGEDAVLGDMGVYCCPE